jgi:hypothetical protein
MIKWSILVKIIAFVGSGKTNMTLVIARPTQ